MYLNNSMVYDYAFTSINFILLINFIIWRLQSLIELTPIIVYMELTYLSSEASIFLVFIGGICKKCKLLLDYY